MATRDTLWTCVGITKHISESGKEVVKVRCGVDLARRIKSSQSKSYIKSRGEKLTPVRADFVELPNPMLRIDALKFALTAAEFQNSEDQTLIHDAILSRTPSLSKKSEKRVVNAKKKSSVDLGEIKTRKKKIVTVEEVIHAVMSDSNSTRDKTQEVLSET